MLEKIIDGWGWVDVWLGSVLVGWVGVGLEIVKFGCFWFFV